MYVMRVLRPRARRGLTTLVLDLDGFELLDRLLG
jgi:hypothetical protein